MLKGVRTLLAEQGTVNKSMIKHDQLNILAIIASATLLLSACGGGAGDSGVRDDDPTRTLSSFDSSLRYQGTPGLESCSVQDLNAWVEHDMRDYYIYYDQVPTVRPADFSDPRDLVAALRVQPDRFSGVANTADQIARVEEGLAVGYGYWVAKNEAGELRFRNVRLESPMYEAGIRRGNQLLALNGIPVEDLEAGQFREIIDAGETTPPTFRVVLSNGTTEDLTVTPGEYTLFTSPTASYQTLADGTRSGYLPITSFLDRTGSDVDFQLQWLIDQNVQRLVLDLRYNGGGRSFQAERVASQLLGSDFDGAEYLRYEFNNKYATDGFARRFEAPELEFPVTSIAILATERSASASEALINGLKPRQWCVGYRWNHT